MSDTSRDLTKFYELTRLHICDLDLQVEDRSQTHETLTAEFPEECLYGVVTKDELSKILESYDKQQGDTHFRNKSVTCDKVVGGSFAKLMNSKPGFHHQGSTSYLLKELGIRDVHRNSFLGGHSTYTPLRGEDIKGLKKHYDRVYINGLVIKASGYLDQGQFREAKREIEQALSVDRNNPEALSAYGRYYAETKQYPDAVRFLKQSLMARPADENSVRLLLSESLFNCGYAQYHRADYSSALNLFIESLSYNPEHENSRLHSGLCEEKIQLRTPFAPRPHTYRK